MSTFSNSIRGSLIRCIAAVAVFFCTLFPNIALCRCVDCNCCGKANAEQSGKKESGCCSQKENLEENLHSCCRHTETDSKDKNSEDKDTCKKKSSHGSCPCLLTANEKAPAVIENAVPVSTPQASDNFFNAVPALTKITFDIPCTLASILLIYLEHSTAPPLRLHLLLQSLVI